MWLGTVSHPDEAGAQLDCGGNRMLGAMYDHAIKEEKRHYRNSYP